MRFFKFFLFFMIVTSSAVAQYRTPIKRANLRAGVNYIFQNGSNYNDIAATGKENIQGNGFIGYRFDPENERANYFGLFGSMSGIQSASITQMVNDSAIVAPPNYTNGKGSLTDVEVGFIFREWFRISVGPGKMKLPVTGGWSNLKYYNATAGLVFRIGAVNLNFNTSTQFGGDIKKPTFRVAAGAALSFNFINAR